MISLHKYFMIAGIIQVAVGGVIEILYWVIFSKLVWILLIYPPPPMYYFVQVMPFLGMLITLVGLGCLMTSMWLFLRADLEFLRKINQL
ncbi:MAG: hypothetical protein LUQ65_01985 [Candidatus Helarchaeota archaeon]|nr:hypothetical protein [Candidatus Helarchaeota archaeon]